MQRNRAENSYTNRKMSPAELPRLCLSIYLIRSSYMIGIHKLLSKPCPGVFDLLKMNQAIPQPFLTFLVTSQSSKIRCDAWSADWLVAHQAPKRGFAVEPKRKPLWISHLHQSLSGGQLVVLAREYRCIEDSTPVVNSSQGLITGLASSRCRSSTTKFRLIVRLLGRVYSVVN
jgi:hypothetical protein